MQRTSTSRWVIGYAAAAAMVSIFGPATAQAGTIYWDGAGADNNWSTLANWGTSGANATTDPVSVPGSADDVVYSSTGGARLTTGTLNNTAYTFQSLTFGNGVNPTATIASGGASGTITLNGKANYDPAAFSSGTSANLGTVGLFVAGGTPTINPAVLTGATQSWYHNGGNSLTLGGGATVGSGHTLTLTGSGGGSSITFASLASADNTAAIIINRTGNSGRVTINGTSAYTGTVTVNAGHMVYGAAASIIDKTKVSIADSATYVTGVAYGAAMDNTFLNNAINSADYGDRFVVGLGASSSNAIDFSGSAGGVALTQATLGAVAGTRTYSGTLTPNGSTYRLGGGGNTLTVTSTLTGTRALNVYGTTTLTPGAANDIGAIGLAIGTLTFSSQNAIGGAGDITSTGGSLTFAGSINTSRNISIASNGLNVNSGGLTVDLSGAVAGTPTIGASGSTLTLSGATNNTGFGGTWNSGTIVLNKTSSSSVHAVNASPVLNGATVRLSGTGGDQVLDTASIGVNTGMFDLNGRSETVANQTGSGGTVTNTAASTLSTLTLGTGQTLTTSNTLRDAAGTLAITKVGAGVVTFSAGNTFSGGLSIQNGTLVATAGSAQSAQAGTGSSGASTFVFTTLPVGTTIGQTVTSPNLAPGTYITAINVGTKTVTLTNAFSTATTSVDLLAWKSLGSNALTLGSGATNGTLDLAGTTQTVKGLAVGAGAAAASQTITNNSASAAATLVFDGTTSTFGGVIKNGTTQSTGLNVAAGSLTLSGANLYTGPTTVSGTLLVNGSLQNTAVTVNANGTLGGSSGTIVGTVGVSGTDASNLATLSPGNSVGTLTVANAVTLGSYSQLEIELDGDAIDLLVAGALDLSSPNDYLVIDATGVQTLGRYVFATYTGSLSGHTLNNVTINGSPGATIDYAVAGEIAVVIPEPGALGLVGLLGLLTRRRRRA